MLFSIEESATTAIKNTLALAGAEKRSKTWEFGEDCLRAQPEFRSRRGL